MLKRSRWHLAGLPQREHVKKLISTLKLLALTGLISAATVAVAPNAQAAVWEPQNSWSPVWEKSYQEWVKTQWTKDFFTKPGPYQNMVLDCADAVYAMRYIFAANNSLPYAINDPSGGRGTISQSATRFDKLAPEKRKVAFLKYINGIVSTQSLVRDSYPLATNRDAIHAGVFLRTVQDRITHGQLKTSAAAVFRTCCLRLVPRAPNSTNAKNSRRLTSCSKVTTPLSALLAFAPSAT